MKNRLFWWCNIGFPLLCGAILYLIFCPETRLCALVSARLPFPITTFGAAAGSLPVFVRCYLMDMLWAYSLIFALTRVTGGKKCLPGFIIAAAFEIAAEMLQSVGIMPGIFDRMDILLEITASLLGTLMIVIYHSKTERERDNQ